MEQGGGRNEATNDFLESVDSADPAPDQYDLTALQTTRDCVLATLNCKPHFQPCVVCEPKIGLLNMAKPIV